MVHLQNVSEIDRSTCSHSQSSLRDVFIEEMLLNQQQSQRP
jgi:hypothetical protein